MKKINLLTSIIGISALTTAASLSLVSCGQTKNEKENKPTPGHVLPTIKLNTDATPNEIETQQITAPLTVHFKGTGRCGFNIIPSQGAEYPEGFITAYCRVGQGDEWIENWKEVTTLKDIYGDMYLQFVALWDNEHLGNFSNANNKIHLEIKSQDKDAIIKFSGSFLSLTSKNETWEQNPGTIESATELTGEYNFSEFFSIANEFAIDVSANLLPWKKLTPHCYDSMFKGCTHLKSAPALPAETLTECCYKDMFSGCVDLKTSGNLPAILLADNCYQNMFYNCENLNLISLAYIGNFSEKHFKDWIKGAGTKTGSGIIRYNGLDIDEKSDFGIPTNFKVIKDETLISNHTKVLEIREDGYSSVISGNKPKVRLYSDQGLKFGQIKDQITSYEPKVAGTPFKAWLKEDKSSELSLTDDTEVAALPNVIIPSYGEDESKRVLAKHCTLVVDAESDVQLTEHGTDQSKSNIQLLDSADGKTWDESKWIKMIPRKKYTLKKGHSYALKGNSQTTDPLYVYTQIEITRGKVRLGGNIMSLALVNGKIPDDPTTLPAKGCFASMFKGSTAIYTIDDNFLPATNLTEFCYASMFNGCTNLTKAPRLPATKAAGACYHWMFSWCDKLQTVPQIALEELVDPIWPIGNQDTKNGVCDHMFTGCTSLVNVPDLKAKKLTDRAYNYMFSGCTSLTKLPKIYATEFADGHYYGEYGLPDTSSGSDIGGSCNGMFSGCTSLKDASQIWANDSKTCPESKIGCFRHMFSGCTNLIKAPTLSDTLSNYCYYQMFANCSSLQVYNGTPMSLSSYKLFSSPSTLPDNATTGMFYNTIGGYKNGSNKQIETNSTYKCGYKES